VKSFVFSAFALVSMTLVFALLVGEIVTEIRSSFKLKGRKGGR
jgi:hypothetical protein